MPRSNAAWDSKRLFRPSLRIAATPPNSVHSGCRAFFIRPSALYNVANTHRGLNRVLMFPDSNNQPSPGVQQELRLSVPFNVPQNLGSPEICSDSGRTIVQRTAVPEAAIHHHRDFRPNEDDICCSRNTPFRPTIQTIAEARLRQFPPQRELWPSTTVTHLGHAEADDGSWFRHILTASRARFYLMETLNSPHANRSPVPAGLTLQ